MRDSAIFDFVADELARSTHLGRAAARDAVRSALALARFDPGSLTASQMALVLDRLLAAEIRRSDVEDADHVCRLLSTRLASQRFAASGPESPDEVFSRLIRR